MPSQRQSASILPVANVSVAFRLSEYLSTSIKLVLSQVLERIVVTDSIYPSLSPLFSVLKIKLLSNQLARQLQRSSTSFALSPASKILIPICAPCFTEASYSVQRSKLLAKHAMLNLPDNLCKWLESFFKDHPHCTKLWGKVSDFHTLSVRNYPGLSESTA